MDSWRRGAGQSAYEIRVAMGEDAPRGAQSLVWDSGKIDSRQSIFVSYGGPGLQSRTRYFWQIRVWDERGLDLGWSRGADWEMGLLSPADWRAPLVSPPPHTAPPPRPPPTFRPAFL